MFWRGLRHARRGPGRVSITCFKTGRRVRLTTGRRAQERAARANRRRHQASLQDCARGPGLHALSRGRRSLAWRWRKSSLCHRAWRCQTNIRKRRPSRRFGCQQGVLSLFDIFVGLVFLRHTAAKPTPRRNPIRDPAGRCYAIFCDAPPPPLAQAASKYAFVDDGGPSSAPMEQGCDHVTSKLAPFHFCRRLYMLFHPLLPAMPCFW